jgi:hypothetical protein
MEASESLKYYLNTLHSLQDYLVGFSLLQTITFLYGLKTFGPSIYPHKWKIIIGIGGANLFNWTLLVIVKNYDIHITDLLISPKSDRYRDLKSIICTGFWFRGLLISFINFLSAAVFYLVAIQKTRPKILID